MFPSSDGWNMEISASVIVSESDFACSDGAILAISSLFAKKANKDEIARMAPSEQAKSDSDTITDADISIFQPSDEGNIAAATNGAFITRFLSKLGTNEAAGYMTADGRYTKQLSDSIQ